MSENSNDVVVLILSLCLFIGPVAVTVLTIIFSSKNFTFSRMIFFGSQVILTALAIMYCFIVVGEVETLYPHLQLEDLDAENIPMYIGLLMVIGLFFFVYAFTACCVFRAQDMGFSKWLTLALLIPIIGPLYILPLLFWPSNSYA